MNLSTVVHFTKTRIILQGQIASSRQLCSLQNDWRKQQYSGIKCTVMYDPENAICCFAAMLGTTPRWQDIRLLSQCGHRCVHPQAIPTSAITAIMAPSREKSPVFGSLWTTRSCAFYPIPGCESNISGMWPILFIVEKLAKIYDQLKVGFTKMLSESRDEAKFTFWHNFANRAEGWAKSSRIKW